MTRLNLASALILTVGFSLSFLVVLCNLQQFDKLLLSHAFAPAKTPATMETKQDTLSRIQHAVAKIHATNTKLVLHVANIQRTGWLTRQYFWFVGLQLRWCWFTRLVVDAFSVWLK